MWMWRHAAPLSPVLGAPGEGWAGWGKAHQFQACHAKHLACPKHKYLTILGFCWVDIPICDPSKPQHYCTG